MSMKIETVNVLVDRIVDLSKALAEANRDLRDVVTQRAVSDEALGMIRRQRDEEEAAHLRVQARLQEQVRLAEQTRDAAQAMLKDARKYTADLELPLTNLFAAAEAIVDARRGGRRVITSDMINLLDGTLKDAVKTADLIPF